MFLFKKSLPVLQRAIDILFTEKALILRWPYFWPREVEEWKEGSKKIFSDFSFIIFYLLNFFLISEALLEWSSIQ